MSTEDIIKQELRMLEIMKVLDRGEFVCQCFWDALSEQEAYNFKAYTEDRNERAFENLMSQFKGGTE